MSSLSSAVSTSTASSAASSAASSGSSFELPAHSLTDPTQSNLGELREQLLDLFCQSAYQEGDFLLSSGKQSTYYINSKQVTLHPQGAVAMGRLLLAKLPADTVGVAGLTLGADPMVTAVSLVGVYAGLSILPLIVRKEAKGHGTQAYIEGITLPPESPVVVLEDVVTTGQSAMKAVTRLRDAGYRVDRILALVDRQQGGAELYGSQGLAFEALFTVAELRDRWQNR
jgi:orotate phosphoribosyltransferase